MYCTERRPCTQAVQRTEYSPVLSPCIPHTNRNESHAANQFFWDGCSSSPGPSEPLTGVGTARKRGGTHAGL